MQFSGMKGNDASWEMVFSAVWESLGQRDMFENVEWLIGEWEQQVQW